MHNLSRYDHFTKKSLHKDGRKVKCGIPHVHAPTVIFSFQVCTTDAARKSQVKQNNSLTNCRSQWNLGTISVPLVHTMFTHEVSLFTQSLQMERGSSVGRMPDSQSREPGFESPLLPFRSLGIFFHFTTPQSIQLYKWVPGYRQWWKCEWIVVAQLLHG